MPSDRPLGLTRRDFVLLLVALVLFAGPLVAAPFHLRTSHKYERAQVITNENMVAYAHGWRSSTPTPISTDIACSRGEPQSRGCYLERSLAANRTVPTNLYVGWPDSAASGDSTIEPTGFPGHEQYEYVLGPDAVYRTTYVVNRSAPSPTNGDSYRIELALTPVSPETALDDVSIPVAEASPVARKAAKNGVSYSTREVDVPETPIRLANGSYYRVYSVGRTNPPLDGIVGDLLTFAAPLAGLVVLGSLFRRVRSAFGLLPR